MNNNIFSFIEHLREKLSYIPQHITDEAYNNNNWFTQENIHYSLSAITNDMLNSDNIRSWLSVYPDIFNKDMSQKNIVIIMAGNIPFVGFFDLIATIITGAKVYVKPSSKDKILMQWVISTINDIIGHNTVKYISDCNIFDGIIATGSNNAINYFTDHYKNVPILTRDSKTSVAIITDNTTTQQIEFLWEDIFMYFGLGCRNVSHIYIPKGFDVKNIVDIWNKKSLSITHPMFLNNYRQTRALNTINGDIFTDGGYFILSEKEFSLQAISNISYSEYDSIDDINYLINNNKHNIQCIVSNFDTIGHVSFGSAQHPQLWDYADNKDLIKFLLSI